MYITKQLLNVDEKDGRAFCKMVRELYQICGGQNYFPRYFNDKRKTTRRKIFKTYAYEKSNKQVWQDVLNILEENGYKGWKLFESKYYTYCRYNTGIYKREPLTKYGQRIVEKYEVDGNEVVITWGYAGTMYGIYINDELRGGNLYLGLAKAKVREILGK